MSLINDKEQNNIFFLIDELEEKEQSTNQDNFSFSLLEENAEMELDMTISQMVDYNINYTIKDLCVICDYYGITKNVKNLKLNKEQIIEAILFFENNITNENIVIKRKQMWFYINQLKKDKFMKKFILF